MPFFFYLDGKEGGTQNLSVPPSIFAQIFWRGEQPILCYTVFFDEQKFKNIFDPDFSLKMFWPYVP